MRQLMRELSERKTPKVLFLERTQRFVRRVREGVRGEGWIENFVRREKKRELCKNKVLE